MSAFTGSAEPDSFLALRPVWPFRGSIGPPQDELKTKVPPRVASQSVEVYAASDQGLAATTAVVTIDRLRSAVAARVPLDAREAASIEQFLVALDSLADPLSQEADPVHVTGSAIVVGPRGVILLKHKRLGIWLQPGGHVDAGETPWDAALREAREETGLDVSFVGPFDADGVPELVHVDVHAGGRGHTHLDTRYVLDGGIDDPRPPAEESQEIDWFDWPTAIELADPGVRTVLEHLQPTA